MKQFWDELNPSYWIKIKIGEPHVRKRFEKKWNTENGTKLRQ